MEASGGYGVSMDLGLFLVLSAIALFAALWIWVVVAGARGKIGMERQSGNTFRMSPAMRKTGLLVLGSGAFLVALAVYLLATGEPAAFLVLGLVAVGAIVVALAWRFGPYGR